MPCEGAGVTLPQLSDAQRAFWRRRKVLCLCQRGNSRSVGLAWILKDELRKQHCTADALAAGVETCSRETLQMLCAWAETIILVDARKTDKVPAEYHSKMLVWDVGSDRYFKGFRLELIDQFVAKLDAHQGQP